MGLFSGIKKAVKKVAKGVKKVFKKVGKFAGKILDSKWAKGLMIAGAVFTGGMALAAGYQGFAAQSGSLLTKFVTGAKDFMGALVSPVATAKEGLAGNSLAGSVRAGAAGAADSANAAAGMLNATGNAAPPINPTVSVGGGGDQLLSGGAKALGGPPPSINPSVVVNNTNKPGGFLSKAAGAVSDFAQTSGGGQIIAGALRGYGEGVAAEELAKEQWKRDRYYDDQWDPEKNQAGLDRLRGAVRDVNVPSGYLKRAMDSANTIPNYTPRVVLKPTGG